MNWLLLSILIIVFILIIGPIIVIKKNAKKINLTKDQLKQIQKRNIEYDQKEEDYK